jgi:hypothetical protein
MLLSFAYFAFGAILRLLVGGRRGEFDKDIELIVLRHQLTVLRRRGERQSSSRPIALSSPRSRVCFPIRGDTGWR